MMLDSSALRVALAVVTITLLCLFYFITYRRTGSAYSGWWCAALLLFFVGNAAYLLDGTAHQAWANPLGNVALVGGAAGVWAGARSLRSDVPRAWRLAVGPGLTGLASMLDQPATNVWAGGPLFLFFMGALIGLGCRELILLDRDYSRVHRVLALAAGALAAFYGGRLVAFLMDGPDGPVFLTVFGSVPTTILSTVMLVMASFAMTDLSHEQQTVDLRARATVDGLTGLLNRTAFMDLAEAELVRLRRTESVSSVILADLDHFKSVNDQFGHAAGDTALRAFAKCCTSVVRSTDLVGRYGGEEFILLLPGVSAERASIITAEISRRMARQKSNSMPFLPTVSYGIAAVRPGSANLLDSVALADEALYRAKLSGRNRSVLAANDQQQSA